MTRATCLGCGCACDDIDVVVRDSRIVDARNACPLGLQWFGDGVVPARVLADGRDVPLEDAADAAMRLLVDASRPLIYLAPDVTCEAQREAIALADRLQATLDTVTSSTAMPSILAAQEQGRAGATLGEVRNRADVLVFWGVDPSERYPRFWSRYAPEPAGVHAPEGRRSRRVVAVDIGEHRGPEDADARISIAPGEEVPVLVSLATSGRVKSAPTESIAAALAGGKYVVFVADAEPQAGRDPGRSAALIALTQALNATTRCALSTLRAGGNRSGADAALTSHTGYPAAVDFSRGYPRYRPHDAAVAREEADAVLVIGSMREVPRDVAAVMQRRACAVIGPRASEVAGARIAIDTGVAGIHEGGTALRMDDVPLPLRRCLEGPPQLRDVLQTLRSRLSREVFT